MLSRSPAVRIATGDSTPSVVQQRLCMCCLLWCPILLWSAELQLQSCRQGNTPKLHACLLPHCFVSHRFNDFLCHTSGMGTVDSEKVLVGNVPSKSLYEYCFHPDQQCWKVNTACLPAVKLDT